MEQFPVDGSTTLAQQRDTLRFIELAGFFNKLLTYVSSSNTGEAGEKVNLASFERTQQKPPDLILVEVGDGQNAVSIIADQLANGKQVVFHEKVFVSGVKKEVLGFR